MANGKLLRQLVRSGADGDVEAFRGVANQPPAGTALPTRTQGFR